VIVWDTFTGHQVWRLEEHELRITGLVWLASAEYATLACCNIPPSATPHIKECAGTCANTMPKPVLGHPTRKSRHTLDGRL